MNFDPKVAEYEKERGIFAVANLHAGLILMTIGAAASEITEPAIGAPITWDDGVFLYDDLNGTRVIVWADGHSVIGLCRYTRSDRHVWHTHDPIGVESFVAAMPTELQEQASRLASLYLRVEVEDGIDVPCVTAGFWSDDGWWLTANEPWTDVFQHGASDVLEPALMPLKLALDWIQARMALSNSQIATVLSLYLRRVSLHNERLVIERNELLSLQEDSDQSLEYIRRTYQLRDDVIVEPVPSGMNPGEYRCRELLKAVGIEVN